MTINILRIDASARLEGSVSRALSDSVIERFQTSGPVSVMERDLAESSLPFIDSAWIEANFTPADRRSEEQGTVLSQSDALIDELRAADVLVIGLPIYNFGMPAALKAWVDLVARAGVTFSYTENGPEGLLRGKRAIVTVASGGTEAGSEIDFATGYLLHFLGFIGITDVVFVTADGMVRDPEATMAKAHAQIASLAMVA